MGWGGDSKYSGSMTEKESKSKVLSIFLDNYSFYMSKYIHTLTIILCFFRSLNLNFY